MSITASTSSMLLAMHLMLAPCDQADQRRAMQGGQEAYGRGEYSKAISAWRALYSCLGEAPGVDETRQMVVELLLSAYYAADLLGPEVARIDDALSLVASYRTSLRGESLPAVLSVWEEKLQERRARLAAEDRAKVLETSLAEVTAELERLRAVAPPVQSAAPRPLASIDPARGQDLRSAKALIASGSVVMAIGLAGAIALPIGLMKAQKFKNLIDDADPGATSQLQFLAWRNNQYQAEALSTFGALSAIIVVPGAVLLGLGLRHLRVARRDVALQVAPNFTGASLRF